MFKSTLLILIAMTLVLQTRAQSTAIKFDNTIAIDKSDSKVRIIEKAAHVIPTTNQLNALKNEFIAFVHFGPNTFTGHEWGNGKEDPNVFDLKTLDTDQWCKAMKAAGMKMVIYTAKHHDGFVLWQSRYTRHGIMSTNFQNGKGDILKDLKLSCKKYGLKLGIYLSPADLFQIESSDGLYGNLSKYTQRSIPREVAGRPFANKTKFQFVVDDYNEYFLNQLFELLTEYGPVDEVWFDGAHPKTKGGQKYNYIAWKKLIHKLAPKAVIFGKEDIRWCGNESGKTRKTEWNVIPYLANPDTSSYFPDLTDESLGKREDLYLGKFLHYQQAETNTSIREGWFYRDDTHQKVRSADDVFDIYERAVGGNSTFLLNIPPNKEGKFPAEDVAVLNEVGKRITQTYGTNLFAKAQGPKQVLDGKTATYVLIDRKSSEIIISNPAPVTINRLVIQEAVGIYSERVEKHALDAWVNNQWKEISAATNIGYKRILRFPEITASKFRLRVTAMRLNASIANITAHYYHTRPPQLEISRNRDGMVNIQPIAHQFGWKPHGEDAAKNINIGVEIFYTTDGSIPTIASKKYVSPFELIKGEVKALAISKREKGALSTEILSIPKKDWKIVASSNSTDGVQPFIVIDLGKDYILNAFAYTPKQERRAGMMVKGTMSVSDDSNAWKSAESFEFGNLVNDPTKRKYFLKSEVKARFVKIEATEVVANKKNLDMSELDFFEK